MHYAAFTIETRRKLRAETFAHAGHRVWQVTASYSTWFYLANGKKSWYLTLNLNADTNHHQNLTAYKVDQVQCSVKISAQSTCDLLWNAADKQTDRCRITSLSKVTIDWIADKIDKVDNLKQDWLVNTSHTHIHTFSFAR